MAATTETAYRTQAEARSEIVKAIWGEVPFARRAYLRAENSGTMGGDHVVVANVNGRSVAFRFDCYGRQDAKTLVLPRP